MADACDPTGSSGPFTRDYAASLGVSSRMLEGRRFVRIHPRIWRHRDHEMTAHDYVRAAALALPADAHTTGITRIQQLGLDFGPRRPLRFVVQGDLHLALDGIFLHRTRALPPTDGVGVARRARSWPTAPRSRPGCDQGGRLAAASRAHGSRRGPRPGARPAVAGRGARDRVDPRRTSTGSRSVRESEVRALLAFSGLPRPRVNVDVGLGGTCVIGDLVLEEWGLVVEYEGLQHQTDRDRTSRTSTGIAEMRRGLGYVQVTHEHLRTPRRWSAGCTRRSSSGATTEPHRVRRALAALFVRVSDLIGQDVRARRRAVA